MPEPLLLTVKNAVATISINDAPYNRMSLDYMELKFPASFSYRNISLSPRG